jgi:prepilin-type N-terminal cleavage/methylation domain-containing protein
MLRSSPSTRLRASFTLIELLVVIAIVAILSVVVIITLNPTELLRQGRDSNRLSDLANINTALNIFQTDVSSGSLGTASTTYISIPDPAATSTAGSQCQGLGLSTSSLPVGWSYHCAASSTLRKADGTGWLPVNLTLISFKSPLGTLPVDPVNTTSSGQYYTYTPGGSWELTSGMESQKYAQQEASDGGVDPAMYETGTNLTLSPFAHGMVGYWRFDEGSGATAIDSSGNGNTGTWYGTGVTHWVAGKVGSYAGQFNGTDDYVDITDYFPQSDSFTVTAWFNLDSGAAAPTSSGNGFPIFGNNQLCSFIGYQPYSGAFCHLRQYATGSQGLNWYKAGLADSNWHHVALAVSQTAYTAELFLDGVSLGKQNIGTEGYTAGNGALARFGKNYSIFWWGKLDDLRLYRRALSAAEVAAIYNATK